MGLKTSATHLAARQRRQTGLKGQFYRANYDAKTTTVSNLNLYKLGRKKANFGLF
jgi:hypothetical protein